MNRIGREARIIQEITKPELEDKYAMYDGFNNFLYTSFEGGTLFLVHGRPDNYLSIMQRDIGGRFAEVQQIKEKYKNAGHLAFSEKYNILAVDGLEAKGIRLYKKSYVSGLFEVA